MVGLKVVNHYFTLGIQSKATTDEIKQAYLKLAKQYHPDKNKSPDATKRMAEINLAYETLCDSQRRKEYDRECGPAAQIEKDTQDTIDVESVQMYEGTSQYYPPHPREDEAAPEEGEFSVEDWLPPSWTESNFYVAACPKCKSTSKKGDKFCSQCGANLGHGKCAQCDFVNYSGIFICSKCGYSPDPAANEYNSDNEDDGEYYSDSYNSNDEPTISERNKTSADEIDSDILQGQQDVLSEIIRCPRCDEINNYSRGSCWQCKLNFETG